MNQRTSGHGMRSVRADLAYQRHLLVNVIFSGPPGAGDRGWTLVDAGLFGSAGRIIRGAEERFGRNARPAAIILTHGHFDHVGALRELIAYWNAPVFAHPFEFPFLTGARPYPPPEPRVGGGAMAALSFAYPRGPYDFGRWLHPLPEEGLVPGMPRWRWVHTPGHTPGHVALVRPSDRTMIAGDAFVTTRQESAIAVLLQRREMHGPPAYFTPDWVSARRSVQMLADLEPDAAITGHGRAFSGEMLREELHELARDFGRRAVPRHGRYVRGLEAQWPALEARG
ncbi:MAG TPA: MBL fold metallo-hydrolase [Gemmatimonadales bacterium]